MQELSMHVLDIAQNSVAAGATRIEISVRIDTAARRLTLTIADNGKGMSEEVRRRVTDPFYTTRTTRKVGLGLPFFAQAAKAAQGSLNITSAPGKGTSVVADFQLGHIDLAPLGDMDGTIVGLIQCNPALDFSYNVWADGQTFCMDTRELREQLGEVPLSNVQVAVFLRQYLREHTENLLKRSTIL